VNYFLGIKALKQIDGKENKKVMDYSAANRK
jgi:hypothetical protein